TFLFLDLFRILDISLVGKLVFGVRIVKLALVAYKLLHCSYTTTFRGFFENSSEKPFYIIEIIKDAVPKGVERRASRQNDHVVYYLREFTQTSRALKTLSSTSRKRKGASHANETVEPCPSCCHSWIRDWGYLGLLEADSNVCRCLVGGDDPPPFPRQVHWAGYLPRPGCSWAESGRRD